MPRINSRLAADYIRDLKPFSSNGALSAEYRGSDYVVSSYETAIASVSNNGAAYALKFVVEILGDNATLELRETYLYKTIMEEGE